MEETADEKKVIFNQWFNEDMKQQDGNMVQSKLLSKSSDHLDETYTTDKELDDMITPKGM